MISGDMNCASRHSFVQDMILKNGLRDAMMVHKNNPPPTRYPGSKTIDFIMVSAEMERCVTGAEYLPFNFMLESDHRAILAELQLGHLFHSDMKQAVKLEKRALRSSHKENSKKYREAVTRMVTERNMGQKCEKLSGRGAGLSMRQERKLLNYLDRSLTRISLKVERYLPKEKPWDFYHRLVQASLIKAYWSIVVD